MSDFKDYAWDKFDVKIVYAKLIGDTREFFGQPEILFNGFCTWMIEPERPDLAREAMRITALKLLEQQARRMSPSRKPSSIDVALSITLAGSPFHKQVFEVMGTTSELASGVSEKQLNAEFNKRSESRRVAIELLKIAFQQAKEHKSLSLNKMTKAALDLKLMPHIKSTKTFENCWKHHVSTISLIYEASLIRSGGPGRLTFLNAACQTRSLYKRFFGQVEPMIDRAQSLVILPHCSGPPCSMAFEPGGWINGETPEA